MEWKVPSPKTKLVELKWPTPSPEDAMTPTNSHKWSSISSVATLENLHINTCITENTSMKRVNTTLEFLLCKKRKGIPLKMLVIPSPFASRNGHCQTQRRERAKNENADGGYISADAGASAGRRGRSSASAGRRGRAPASAGWRGRIPASVRTCWIGGNGGEGK
jgi:hypothetical protein